MEQAMLLNSLAKADYAMTAQELANYWHPTWTVEEIEAMLNHLIVRELVTCENRGLRRYRHASVDVDLQGLQQGVCHTVALRR